MKINEASVIDNKVIDDMIAEYENKIDNIFITDSLTLFMEGQLSILKHIKQQIKPLEPIVRNFHNYGQFAKMELLSTGKINIHSVDQYIKQTEI